MSQQKVRAVFESEMTTNFGTTGLAYEGITYTPTVGTEYIELYHLPALNDGIVIDNSNYENRGIFQATLRYPYGTGTGAISTKADAITAHFKKGAVFILNGVRVRIQDTPNVRNLGKDGDRIVYVVRVNYNAFIIV